MRASRPWLLAVLLATTASCSLTGLDHFRVGSCAGTCAALNARDGLVPGACHSWQCDATGQFCELPLVIDHDHDGHTPIACGGSDCDDEDEDSVQGAAETCDGLDNDCNGLVDDVSGPVTTPAPVMVVSGAMTPRFVTYAAAADGVVVGWRSGATAQLARVQSIDAPSTARMLGTTANADPESALTSATPATGCPSPALVSLAPELCDAAHACATAGLVCVMDGTREICEPPVTPNTPPHAMECATHAECQDGLACNGREVCDPTGPAAMLDARGCRAGPPMPCATAAACDEVHDACITNMLGTCSFGDLALDRIGASEWMTLAITTDGCANGRVRPSSVDATAAMPALRLWGDHRLSTTWAGVDLDDMGCTGGGAAGVAIAALAFDTLHERTNAQALAAWRAAPACSGVGGCAAPASAPVEILGLWRERGTVGGMGITWVDGSDDGAPTRLPDAASSPRVSVASWALDRGAAGYTVAYGRAGGGVALAFVHAFTATSSARLAPVCGSPMPPVCLEADPGPDRIVQSRDDGESFTRVALTAASRTTPSLGTPIVDSVQATDAVVGDVVIATGPLAGATEVPLALAWATATEVTVASVAFDPSDDMVTEGSVLRLPASGARDVSIVHLDAGLGAAPHALGGFVVVWVTAEGTFGVRIADDGTTIPPGVMQLGAATDHPRAFVDAGGHARVLAHQGDAFVAFPTVCGSAP